MILEKDWSARFEHSDAWLGIVWGFRDSMGRPRNSDFVGHLRVYVLALFPALVPAAAGWPAWRMRRKSNP